METAELRRLVEDQLRLSGRLRARIRELEDERSSPLAIVGMALRFPGGLATPEEYWEFLLGDGTGIGDIPDDRPGLRAVHHPEVGRPGSSYVDRAGFLSDVARFDADFFGISQREAETLDPQQRLLLETAWEALERAGIAVRRADRLDAGVFVGIMAAEYGERFATGDPEHLDPYYGTGGGHCFAAGRISYALGLRGPAFSVDTACSSSLVALHQAARSLRARECRYAIVGAANLIFSPHLMVSLCQSRALAPDGRSKPFTAAADGYGRGEGVASVVLMRLADAVAERRPVLALVRGTAVNHDGAASGLTVPSGPAQTEVIQAALRDAGVDPGDVSYVEAHGTGTALGDPIEAGALEAVFGGAVDRLLVSSVKARLGHLEAAAGMAGLIKLVLMLRHGRIVPDVPDSLGPLNPAIPWPQWHLEVPRQVQQWSGPGRTAGISAFGLSGTNAHVIVQSADDPPTKRAEVPMLPERRAELVVLSARTKPALSALAASVSNYLFRADSDDLASVCHTLRAGRAPLAYRLAVTGATPAELARELSLAAGVAPRAVTNGAPRSAILRTAHDSAEAIAAGVARLAAALPLIGPPDNSASAAVDTGSDEAMPWLVRAFEALDLPVQVQPGPVPDGHVVAVEYGGRRFGLLPRDAGRTVPAFLAAVGELFQAGADLRMTALATPDARFLPDLPTYPFQRRRFWVAESEPSRREAVTATPATPGVEHDGAAPDQVAVEKVLRAELAAVLKAEEELDLRCTFAEVGGDSFTAMLFVSTIEDRFQADDLAADFAVDEPLGDLLTALAREITERVGAAR